MSQLTFWGFGPMVTTCGDDSGDCPACVAKGCTCLDCAIREDREDEARNDRGDDDA